MIIRLADIPEVLSETSPLAMKRIIVKDQHGDDISATWCRIWGHHDTLVSDISDRLYYVIEGTGEFRVGDEPPGKVTTGDFVWIPKGVPYGFDGDMTYVVANGPAYVPGTDRVLK